MDINELYTKHPELEEIALRLEESEKKAKEINNKRKREYEKTDTATPENTETKGDKRRVSENAEHAKISRFLKDARWHDLNLLSKPGRVEFENTLERIIRTRQPDAIEILIYPSSRELKVRVQRKIQLTDAKDTEPEPNEKTTEALGTIEKQLADLKEAFSSKAPVSASGGISLEVLQLTHAANLKEIEQKLLIEQIKNKHDKEIDTIKREHERQVNELNEHIEELEEEIEELEEDAAETEENLSGIEQKIEAAKNPELINVLGSVVKNAAEKFAREHVEGIAKFGGFDKEEIEAYFKKKDEEKQLADANGEKKSEASYEDVTDLNNPLAGLDANKKDIVLLFIKVAERVEAKDLKLLGFVLDFLINPDFTINEEFVDVMLEAARAHKTKKEENTNA